MGEAFPGFPTISKATAIPNLYLATILPEIDEASELLAFLWATSAVQAKSGEHRYVDEEELWAQDAVRRSFARLGGGREGLRSGLCRSVERGVLLEIALRGGSAEGDERLYFVNNPASRRTVARARAGELALRPGTVVVEPEHSPRPGVFAMYEAHIGTITPFVGERLLAAADRYPPEWIEEAFREAAEMNVRSWRYVERTLESMEREGRVDGANRRDSLEERKRRFR